MKASILDLRYRTREVLRAVERGEAVTVLYRGKPKARILPLARSSRPKAAARHEAFGLWRDREAMADVSGYVRGLRQGRFGGL